MDSIYSELVNEDQFFTNFLKTRPNRMKLDMYLRHFSFANRYTGISQAAFQTDTQVPETL